MSVQGKESGAGERAGSVDGPSAQGRSHRVDPRLAETRRLVKAATLELISEVGFEGTTVEGIAERSGVSRTTIYRHWPDPSVLLLEAFDPPSDDLQPPGPTGDVRVDLRNYIQHVADRLNDDRFAAALSAQIDKARRDAAYREAQLQYAVARNEHAVNLFRAGVASGELRAGLDPVYEADMILGYLVYQRLVRHRRLDAAVVATTCDNVIERCVVGAERSGGVAR